MVRRMVFIQHSSTVCALSAILLVAACTLSVPSWAFDELQSRATLRGVTSLNVVADLDPVAERDDPTLKDRIQRDMEQRLQEVGITINPAAVEWLHVSVYTHHADPGYAFTVQISFEQLVQLMRGPRILTLAPTWSSGATGVIPDLGPDGRRILQDAVAGSVGQFVNAYLEQNPKGESNRGRRGNEPYDHPRTTSE